MSILRRLWALSMQSHVDREIKEELRVHLEMRTADNIAAGMTEDEARRDARLRFGNPEAVKERVQAVDMALGVDSVVWDVRFALRQLRRSPGFACAAVLMLALSVGANTVIFSVVNAVLLKPLPFYHPDKLVRLWDRNAKTGLQDKMTGAEWAAWRERGGNVFTDMAAGWDDSYTLTGSGEPQSLIAFAFTPNVFSVLGSSPLLGRTFAPRESRVAVLTYALWERQFGGRKDVVGQQITLNNEPYTVTGVMPKGLEFPGKFVDLWTPLTLGADIGTDNNTHILQGVARLRDGVTITRAQAALNSLRVAVSGTESRGAVVESIRDAEVGNARPALLVLQAAVLLLMLVATANIASILLARATVREREVAIRIALGAGKRRLLFQFLVEGLTLSAIGGGLGIILAGCSMLFLPHLLPANIYLSLPQHLSGWMDFRVLVFAVGVAMLSGVVFSLVPLFRLPRTPNQTLGTGERSATRRVRTARLRSTLVGAQIAVSLVLLIGSGLLLRSFVKLESQTLGYRTDHVLTLQMIVANVAPAQEPQWIARVLNAVRTVPGVESVAAISGLPLSGVSARRPYSVSGMAAPPTDVMAAFRMVTPEWFHTMAIPLLHGRTFDEDDRQGIPGVVIVNETLARRLWQNDNPVGKTIIVPDFGTPETREVVGVVGDTLHNGPALESQPEIYRPLYQTYFPLIGVAIHTYGDPARIADTVRRVLHSEIPGQPLGPMLTMQDRAAESVVIQRESAALLALFSAIAFLLATLGIYGVVSYSVARRTKEIGIRLVLGARRENVITLVMREGMTISFLGLGVGLMAALFLTRLMHTLLFGVGVVDPITFVTAPLTLLCVSLVACYVPARRAARIQPMVALRWE